MTNSVFHLSDRIQILPVIHGNGVMAREVRHECYHRIVIA